MPPNHRIFCLSTIGQSFFHSLFYVFIIIVPKCTLIELFPEILSDTKAASQSKVFTFLFVFVLTHPEATVPLP